MENYFLTGLCAFVGAAFAVHFGVQSKTELSCKPVHVVHVVELLLSFLIGVFATGIVFTLTCHMIVNRLIPESTEGRQTSMVDHVNPEDDDQTTTAESSSTEDDDQTTTAESSSTEVDDVSQNELVNQMFPGEDTVFQNVLINCVIPEDAGESHGESVNPPEDAGESHEENVNPPEDAGESHEESVNPPEDADSSQVVIVDRLYPEDQKQRLPATVYRLHPEEHA